MTLQQRIEQDTVAAMKERAQARLDVLRMVKAAIKNKEIDKREKLHATRSSVVKEGIERRARGAPGVENIVDQNDVAPSNVKTDGAGNHRDAASGRGQSGSARRN